MNKTALKWILTGIVAGYAAVGFWTYKVAKNAIGSFDNEIRSDVGEIRDSLNAKIDSSFVDFENTRNYFRASMKADLDSTFNDLTKKLEEFNDEKEFPHIENFTNLAKHLRIQKSELRNIQKYFKDYNEQIKSNIKYIYSTNL